MGLIKAAMGAAGGVMADQWKEFFYCDALDQDTLMIKGQKRTGARSSNTKGSDNIISNGSGIAVANGQCMMIVEQGKVVEVCAEPGEYTYDTSSEPSIFAGNLSDSIKSTFMTIGKRFTYGGDTGKDQRVYYFNTKEITDNKFGTANPVWFRVVDEIDTQLRTEFINALQPALAKIAELEIRPSQIPAHSMEIGDAMNEVLTKKWSELRGISIVSVAFNPVTLKEEDAEAIKQAQNASMYRDPNMMAATLGMAQAEAMKTAAGNPNGAMMGFMGMNMAGGGMGGMNLQGLYNQGAAQQQMQQQQMQEQQMREQQMQQQQIKQQKMAQNTQTTETAAGWTCACGKVNTGKFCIECGKPKPADGWTCSCGTVNKGKFCMECGKPKPAGEPLYRCDKCGWEPEDPKNPPRFCPECGDPFDENDMQ